MKTPPTTIEGPWTILSLLKWTTSYFASHAIDNPRSTAEVLLAHALGLKRIDLYLQYDRPMHADELKGYKALIKRRVAREPVAYITGTREFWSLDFQVNRDVLIPRPETECLVEAALEVMHKTKEGRDPLNILELGTGSGAVVTALASQQPGHRYFASDISTRALAMARENSVSLGQAGIFFFAGDWLKPVRCTRTCFNLIVSNPPYIPSGEIKGLQPEIHGYEPVRALDGEDDGLGCLRRIIATAPDCLVSGGALLLEIGYGQREGVEAIARQWGCYDQVAFDKDYSGILRVVRLRKAAAE
jgi:release factor glutamine methyltransferase